MTCLLIKSVLRSVRCQWVGRVAQATVYELSGRNQFTQLPSNSVSKPWSSSTCLSHFFCLLLWYDRRTDVTDGTHGTDGIDGIEGTDGTDRKDGTDGTDGTDRTDRIDI